MCNLLNDILAKLGVKEVPPSLIDPSFASSSLSKHGG